jgi:hypothetical protein
VTQQESRKNPPGCDYRHFAAFVFRNKPGETACVVVGLLLLSSH